VTEARTLRALQQLKTMGGPITVRVSHPGERHFRYTDAQGQGPQLTGHGGFRTPEAARRGLNLAPNEHGWLRQAVVTRRPTLVLDAHARGGTVTHTLLVRRDDVANLEFGRASRYGLSASSQEGAADMGRIAHDERTEAREALAPHDATRLPDLATEARQLSDDARHLGMDVPGGSWNDRT
jgi:hypothetical protein